LRPGPAIHPDPAPTAALAATHQKGKNAIRSV
jgi:hypothetical protein